MVLSPSLNFASQPPLRPKQTQPPPYSALPLMMVPAFAQLGHFRPPTRHRYLLSIVEHVPTPSPRLRPVPTCVSVQMTSYSRWPPAWSVRVILNVGARPNVVARTSAPALNSVGLSPQPGILPKCSPSDITEFITS